MSSNSKTDVLGDVHPPPPFVQRINTLLHQEPFSTLSYCWYWSFILIVGTPLALLVLQIKLLAGLYTWFRNRNDPLALAPCHPKANTTQTMGVLITGCDTGFGNELAMAAADAGYTVFAGCLLEKSISGLEKYNARIKAFPLDVTKDEQVAAAVQRVENWVKAEDDDDDDATAPTKRVFHALVNVAGIGVLGLVDMVSVNDFQKCMDVNVFGTIRCCKGFLPLLKSQAIEGYANARILNMVSSAGMVPTDRGTAPYATSKFACQAFTQAFALEVIGFNIQVGTINPTFHQTPMVANVRPDGKAIWDALDPELRDQYGEAYRSQLVVLESFATRLAWNVENVTVEMMKCLTAQKVPPESVVGMDGKFLFLINRILPAWFRVPLLCLPQVKPAAMLKQS